jgi:V/A-type H+-transporting ATPase subunit E
MKGMSDLIMEGIEKIINHIKSVSAKECQEITDSAIIECERIRAEYLKIEEDEYWKIINAGKKEAQQRLDQLCSLAELESKKQVLSTQQEMLSEAFKLAADMFRELSPKTYISFLIKLACDSSLSGTEEVILSPADKELFGSQLLNDANAALSEAGKKAELTLSDKTANICGGLILFGDNVITDCSTEVLVARHRNALTQFAAEQLFD